jgi:hypothetical protein
METAKKGVTRAQFLENQRGTCRRIGAPFFMPADGKCFRCKRDIIPELIANDEDGTGHVTGCPLCCRSYCE